MLLRVAPISAGGDPGFTFWLHHLLLSVERVAMECTVRPLDMPLNCAHDSSVIKKKFSAWVE